jgi:hypothetical protein
MCYLLYWLAAAVGCAVVEYLPRCLSKWYFLQVDDVDFYKIVQSYNFNVAIMASSRESSKMLIN